MSEAWRDLRIGDRIRIVRFPFAWNSAGYFVHADTRRLYRRLITRGRSVRIYKLDEQGLPWVQCRFVRTNGLWEYHHLAVNDDSWGRVRHRV